MTTATSFRADNFRRHLIPRARALAKRFTNTDKLVARLDVPEWQAHVTDNDTNVREALEQEVVLIMGKYREVLGYDVDIGALAGDLLLLKFSHEVRALGGRIRPLPVFATFNASGLSDAYSSLLNAGHTLVAPSVPLVGPPLLPVVPSAVSKGSFRGDDDPHTNLFVIWDTVCCGCCGFSSEIMHFLHPLRKLRRIRVTVGRDCFCDGYDGYVADNIRRMNFEPSWLPRIAPPEEILIWVSHAGPWSYYNPELVLRRPDYFIGRSMYEFTKIPNQWAAQIRPINEVWVPGQWVRDVFVANGVDASKVLVMPEAIDVEYYNPEIRGRVALPLEGRSLQWKHYCNGPGHRDSFKFFSNFKWEPRKGWDILFESYFREFKATEAVSVYVLTNVVGTSLSNTSQIEQQFESWAGTKGFTTSLAKLPHFCLITEMVPEETIGDLYNSADAFRAADARGGLGAADNPGDGAGEADDLDGVGRADGVHDAGHELPHRPGWRGGDPGGQHLRVRAGQEVGDAVDAAPVGADALRDA
jgi:glycosyltransferase involved in cell wall biosynthesis